MLWATHDVPWLVGRAVGRSAVRSLARLAWAGRFEPGVGDDDGRASRRRGVIRCLAAPGRTVVSTSTMKLNVYIYVYMIHYV